jgi:predicted permease
VGTAFNLSIVGAILVGTFWHDLRYTIRVLTRDRGFTAVAVLSLALGIGANTAVFTLINALLLRNLPVRHPERLVELSSVRRDGKIPFSFPMFREIEPGQRVFSGLIGWSPGGMYNVELNGVLSQEHVSAVTGNYYSELGVTPLLGRLITPEDVNPRNGSTSQVAVLDYEFWQRRFGANPNVVGQGIRIEGQPFTVLGVTRKWFAGMTPGEPPEVTIPITAQPLIWGRSIQGLDDRSLLWVFATGRLKDGVTIEQARAQLQSFWPDVLVATAPTQTPGPRLQTFLSMGLDVAPAATGIAKDLRSKFTRPLYVLLGIVGLILVVACVNLANLMLARAAARSHEMSVRVALGASRWMLARQVLTESLTLSLAGALLGLALAYWGSRFLVSLMAQAYLAPLTFDLRPDLRVLALTAGTAILTGILFGVAPAWRASREDPSFALQQNARSSAGGVGRLSKALIVTQVALSVVLLVGAGLLVGSFERLSSIEFGFQKENLLEITLNHRPGGYQDLDMDAYNAELIRRISSLPGVSSVGFSDSSVPNPEGWRYTTAAMSGDSSARADLMANLAIISPGFFRTLGITLLRGRDFEWADDDHHPHLAIVSNSLAARLFPGGNAIGQRIRFGVTPELQDLEIVGIASDARVFDLRDTPAPVVYVSGLQLPKGSQWSFLFVRTNEPPEAIARPLVNEIELLGHEYVSRTRTVAQVADQFLVPERVTAVLSGFFAALALLLASVGLYGLMSYAVARRTREIGIRVALGAKRKNILWMVLREALALALLGLAIGVPCALAASQLITSILFGVSPSDLPTMAVVSLLLLIMALVAGYLPARRASEIDPVVALRSE